MNRVPLFALCAATALLPPAAGQAVLRTASGSNPDDRCGAAVAVLGDVDGDRVADLAVGIPGDDRGGRDAGCVLVLSGADGSVLHTYTGSQESRFGTRVAASGDVDGDGRADLLVGAPDAQVGAGLATLLSPAQGTTLLAVPGRPSARVGDAVAGCGDLDGDGHDDFLIGNSTADRRGSVTVWSGRTRQLRWTLLGDRPGDAFGAALAGTGDLDGDGTPDFAVGMPGHDAGGADAGAVRAFSGASGQPLYTRNGTDPGDAFGAALAAAGDTDGDTAPDLVVGAPGHATGAGAVYLLRGTDGSTLRTWAGGAAGDALGSAVAAGGDLDGDGRGDVIGGAPGTDRSGPDSGAVLTWSGADGRLLHTVSGLAPGDAAGAAVAVLATDRSGDVDGDGYADSWIGAPGAGASSGRASLHGQLPHDGVTVGWTGAPAGADAKFGGATANAGDVDADGIDDFVVGARHDNNKRGTVWVYSGADQRLLHRFEGDADGDSLGTAVAAAGDVDGDGHDDLWLGAWHEQSVTSSNGMGRLYSGRDGSVLLSVYGNAYRDHMGTATAGIGDVDGDRVPDLAVGLGIRGPGTEQGAVWVYSGASGQRLYQIEGKLNFEWFGWVLAALGGDLDGDGAADFLATGPQFLPTTTGPGLVRVVSGRDGAIIRVHNGRNFGDRFGYGLAAVGDLDRDGVPDYAIGAPRNDTGGDDAGRVDVYSGATGAVLQTLVGAASGDDFGSSLAGGRDLDGDGVPDLAVGAPGTDTVNGGDTGAVSLFSGADFRLLTRLDGRQSGSTYGGSVALLGDANGDHYPELVVGAGLADTAAGVDAGEADHAFSQARTGSGVAVRFGQGCPTSAGSLPGIPWPLAQTRPTLGTTWTTSLAAAPASQAGAAVVGASDAWFGSLPLPFALPLAAGCLVHTDLLVAVPVVTDARGRAQLTVPLANRPTLLGGSAYLQWVVADPAANALGIVLSGAQQLILGG